MSRDGLPHRTIAEPERPFQSKAGGSLGLVSDVRFHTETVEPNSTSNIRPYGPERFFKKLKKMIEHEETLTDTDDHQTFPPIDPASTKQQGRDRLEG